MSAMLVFTLTTFSQDTTLTNKQKRLHEKYDWYFNYIGSNKVPLSYNDWLKKENLVDISGVNYVKKPKSTYASINDSTNLKYSDLISATLRPSGTFTSYVSKNGDLYKIGDVLRIGTPSSNKTFAYISEGDIFYAIFGTTSNARIGESNSPVQATMRASGQKTEITKFWIGGNKRTGFEVLVRSKSAALKYTIKLEMAIETGEIKSFGMTSDEALTELKKDKDKLELGLITQQKYDSLKIELAKYIK